MPVCDICNRALDPGEGKVVPISEMQTIARNGFGPHKLGLSGLGGVHALLGLDESALDKRWRQQVLADTTPWLLCPNCYTRTRPFTAAKPQRDFSISLWPELPQELRDSPDALQGPVSTVQKRAEESARAWEHHGSVPRSYLSIMRTLTNPSVAEKIAIAALTMLKTAQDAGRRIDTFYEHPEDQRVIIGVSAYVGDLQSMARSFTDSNFAENEFYEWSLHFLQPSHPYYMHVFVCLDLTGRKFWYLFGLRGLVESHDTLPGELVVST